MDSHLCARARMFLLIFSISVPVRVPVKLDTLYSLLATGHLQNPTHYHPFSFVLALSNTKSIY